MITIFKAIICRSAFDCGEFCNIAYVVPSVVDRHNERVDDMGDASLRSSNYAADASTCSAAVN